ncbi:MAG: hypothetical protein ACOY0T_33975 [Myxococcota bacterium]
MYRIVPARAFTAAAAAFAAFTGVWLLLGLANNGDAFPQGLAVPLLPLLLIAPALAGYFAWRRETRGLRVALSLLSLLAAVFWLLVPDGWWAVGPPAP